MQRLIMILLALSFAAAGAEAQDPPANDLCANAILTGAMEIFGSTAGASNEGTSACDNENSPDVWYRYVGPLSEDRILYFDTEGSTFDTVVSLHSACPENSSSRRVDCGDAGCEEISPSFACDDDGLDEFAASGAVAPSNEIYIRVTGTHPAAAGSFRLRLGEAGMVSGRVIDQLSGEPIVDAVVKANHPDALVPEARTDASGRYSLFPVQPGIYEIEVQNVLANVGGSFSEQPGGGSVKVRVGEEVEGIDFQLVRRAMVSGRVLDATGQPISDAVVRPNDGENQGSPVTTDEEGRYQLWLDTGSYRLEADVPSHRNGFYPSLSCQAPVCDESDLASAARIQVAQGGVIEDADITLERRAGFSGRVNDVVDGLPVSDAKIEVFGEDRELLTTAPVDGEGFYEVGGLDAGSYYTRVLSDSHRDELRGDLACPDGACDPLDAAPIVLRRNLQLEDLIFELDRWAILSGRVIDFFTREPVAGVQVSFRGETGFFDEGVRTDEDGRFSLAGVEPGRYWAKAEPVGGSPYLGRLFGQGLCPLLCDIEQSDLIEVGLSETIEGIDFEFFLGGRITGRILAEENGVPVQLAQARVNGFTSQIDEFGRYEIIGLPQDRYEVLAEAPGYLTRSSGAPFLVELGESIEGLDFFLSRPGGVSGFVRAANGAPLMDVPVSLFVESGRFLAEAISDRNGLYAFPGLAPGTYFAVAGDNDRLPRVLWETRSCPPFGCRVTEGTPIVVAGGGDFTRGIDFTMAGSGSISGTIIDVDTTAPLMGVRVDIWNELGWNAGHAFTDAFGRYSVEVNPGSYWVSTDNGELGGISELFDDFACPDGSALLGLCDLEQVPRIEVPTGGEQIANFDLQVDQGCHPGPNQLCLGEGGRFQVGIDWAIGDRNGTASGVRLTQDSGYFWFFNEDNIEVVVKVLDGCSLAGNRFWVFAGGLTDVETTMTVTDTLTGEIKVYRNQEGTPFAPILDTNAFDTCSAVSFRGTGESLSVTPDLSEKAKTLELNQDRFEVEVDWSAPGFGEGQAEGIQLTNDSGYFWFFNEDNVEIVVKVLDGCAEPQETYWVFAAGLTDVEARLRVTDTLSGEVREYFSAQGEVFQPILDTQAFATCP